MAIRNNDTALTHMAMVMTKPNNWNAWRSDRGNTIANSYYPVATIVAIATVAVKKATSPKYVGV